METSAEVGRGGDGGRAGGAGGEGGFEQSGTFSSAETVAVFVTVPPRCAGSTATSTVTVHIPPDARLASVQLTLLPAVAEQSPPPSCTLSTESAAGTESLSVTFDAASGPALETTRS